MFDYVNKVKKEQNIYFMSVYIKLVKKDTKYFEFLFSFPFFECLQKFLKDSKIGQWLFKKKNTKIQMKIICYPTIIDIVNDLPNYFNYSNAANAIPTMIESKLRCKKCGRFYIIPKICSCKGFGLKKVYEEKRKEFRKTGKIDGRNV